MTKEMKIKALARIQQAAQKFKDDETLGEAVREALAELAAEEKAHREAAKAEHEANAAKKGSRLMEQIVSIDPGLNAAKLRAAIRKYEDKG